MWVASFSSDEVGGRLFMGRGRGGGGGGKIAWLKRCVRGCVLCWGIGGFFLSVFCFFSFLLFFFFFFFFPSSLLSRRSVAFLLFLLFCVFFLCIVQLVWWFFFTRIITTFFASAMCSLTLHRFGVIITCLPLFSSVVVSSSSSALVEDIFFFFFFFVQFVSEHIVVCGYVRVGFIVVLLLLSF